MAVVPRSAPVESPLKFRRAMNRCCESSAMVSLMMGMGTRKGLFPGGMVTCITSVGKSAPAGDHAFERERGREKEREREGERVRGFHCMHFNRPVAMLGESGSKGRMGRPKESSYSVGVIVKDIGAAVATLLVMDTSI